VWTRIDERAPPRATTEDASFQKVVGAAALEAATTAAIGAAVDRATARTFHYLTGIWPGVHREPALPGTALEQKQIEQQQQIEQQEQ
jgi:hypothetical protein